MLQHADFRMPPNSVVQVWFSGADKHREDERIDQTAYRDAVQALHEAGAGWKWY